jgi:hypothetical protein
MFPSPGQPAGWNNGFLERLVLPLCFRQPCLEVRIAFQRARLSLFQRRHPCARLGLVFQGSNRRIGFANFDTELARVVDASTERRKSRRLTSLHRAEAGIVGDEEARALVPRGHEGRRLIGIEEEALQLGRAQGGGEDEGLVLPSPSRRRIPLLRDQPQDAESFEIVREGNGGAALEFVHEHGHGVSF